MSETIIAALIAAGASLVVSLITNHYTQNRTMAVFEVKLDELTRRVEAHNQVIDRTYRLEKKADLYEEKIKVANHRIDDLEKEVEHG